MNKICYLLTESYTSAMKGYRILSRNSISAKVEKVGTSVSRRGCTFAIVIFNSPQKAVKILQENNVRILSVKER